MGRSQLGEQMLPSRWGVASCARCGAIIVLGEISRQAQIGGRRQRVCSSCATAPSPSLSAAAWPNDLREAA